MRGGEAPDDVSGILGGLANKRIGSARFVAVQAAGAMRWPIRHDGAMAPTVWISTTTPEITHDNENPGDHWQLVGEIDTAEESEFWKNIRLGSSGTSAFYLSGDPDNTWVEAAKRDPRSLEPFWLAIDRYGTSRVLYADGAGRKYFVSTEKATVTKSMRRRPPVHNPGKTVMVGIQLKRNGSGLLVPVERGQ